MNEKKREALQDFVAVPQSDIQTKVPPTTRVLYAYLCLLLYGIATIFACLDSLCTEVDMYSGCCPLFLNLKTSSMSVSA